MQWLVRQRQLMKSKEEPEAAVGMQPLVLPLDGQRLRVGSTVVGAVDIALAQMVVVQSPIALPEAMASPLWLLTSKGATMPQLWSDVTGTIFRFDDYDEPERSAPILFAYTLRFDGTTNPDLISSLLANLSEYVLDGFGLQRLGIPVVIVPEPANKVNQDLNDATIQTKIIASLVIASRTPEEQLPQWCKDVLATAKQQIDDLIGGRTPSGDATVDIGGINQ